MNNTKTHCRREVILERQRDPLKDFFLSLVC
jgi:hypothetical protein